MVLPQAAQPLYLEDIQALVQSNPSHARHMLIAMQAMPSAPGEISEQFSRSTTKAFVTEILGERPSERALSHGITTPWTDDQGAIMDAADSRARADKYIAIRSGNGLGKTKVCAWIALKMLYESEDTCVITTAPTARQVEQLLWGEIRQSFRLSKTQLPGRDLMTSIKLAEKWFAAGYTAKVRKGDASATGFQGTHSKRVIVIVDEATDVPEEIWQAIKRITLGPHDKVIAIGNPTDPASYFARLQEFKRPDSTPLWRILTLSGENHPNVVYHDPEIILGAVTEEWIEDLLHESGSRDSALFRSAVLGLFPTDNPDALIKLSWLIRAQLRYEEIAAAGGAKEDRKGECGAIDVAGTGSDLTVVSKISNGVWSLPNIVHRKGTPKEGDQRSPWHQGQDVDAAIELARDFLDSNPKVRTLVVDDTGIGGGCTAGLRALQRKGKIPKYRTTDGREREVFIMPINFGAAPLRPSKYDIMKDELWWELRESFRLHNDLAIPPEHELAKYRFPRGTNLRAQLTAPIYMLGPGGVILVLDKRGAHNKIEATKNLPAKSPDIAHSMMLANFGWRRLRADNPDARPAATNLMELFHQKIAADQDKAKDMERRKAFDRGGKGPMNPLMRRGGRR